jgi:cytidylate kinase
VAPLRAAEDAITIDTSDIDAETVVALALKHIKALALAE